jgi:hypothetical protein
MHDVTDILYVVTHTHTRDSQFGRTHKYGILCIVLVLNKKY